MTLMGYGLVGEGLYLVLLVLLNLTFRFLDMVAFNGHDVHCI